MTSTVEVSAVPLTSLANPLRHVDDEIVVGKDILELLTAAMYADPLCIYREYIQNACDSIDEASAASLYTNGAKATVDIWFDHSARTVRIRDNGIGVPQEHFVRVLTAIGGSHKRGTRLRGFRGIGRLSGLGYCQELVFRSRAVGDSRYGEMTWSGRALKSILRSAGTCDRLDDAIRAVAEYRFLPANDQPGHFFEVELRKVARVGNDVLLNENEVRTYLSQVAPVPFDASLKYADEINSFLAEHRLNATYDIRLSDGLGPIVRPHSDTFPIGPKSTDRFTALRTFAVEGIDGDMAGVGWILDHSYLGAIPKRAAISGFRVRSGNIQVGSIDLLSHLFPEARFNSWSVAELHVIHPKIVPNGRRDDFEPNAHYQQLLGGVAPLAKQIGKICRDQSIIRNRLRKAHALVEAAGEALSILDATDQHDVLFETVASRVQRCCETLKQIASSTTTTPRDRSLILAQVTTLEHNLERVARSSRRKSFLKKLNPTKRIAYEHVLRLIYEHTSDLRAAHHLAQRILASIRKDVSPRRK